MKMLVDEIRDIVGEARTRGMYPVITDAASDLLGRSCWSEDDEAELFTIIADRIEREYMQLPLDADGVPIKVGDVVWFVGGAEYFDVLGIDGDREVYIGRNDGTSTYAWAAPSDLTHNQTDSLERIEEDARKELWHYWGCSGARCVECPALIDGNTPKDHYHTDSCEDAKVLDLLRRQRLILEGMESTEERANGTRRRSTMPTNDERREVAARLRNYENLRESLGESPICAFLDALGVEYLDWKGVCSRLSDLIEPEPINGETSDGYHTFNELYHHRAVLFSVVVRNYPELCWKSKKHHTGDMYEGMFIVGINTPDGQASYHYDIEPYWDMFDCEELEFAPEWDGHTPAQSIERIGKLTRVVEVE